MEQRSKERTDNERKMMNRQERLGCPVCEFRNALDRIISMDLSPAHWAFFCRVCGSGLYWLPDVGMWEVM